MDYSLDMIMFLIKEHFAKYKLIHQNYFKANLQYKRYIIDNYKFIHYILILRKLKLKLFNNMDLRFYYVSEI